MSLDELLKSNSYLKKKVIDRNWSKQMIQKNPSLGEIAIARSEKIKAENAKATIWANNTWID